VALPSASTCGLATGAGTSGTGAAERCTGAGAAVCCAKIAKLQALTKKAVKTKRDNPDLVPEQENRDIILPMN
jgi:hypothetical protein